MYPMLKDESGGVGGGERQRQQMFLRPMLLNLGKFKIRPGKWPRKGPERDKEQFKIELDVQGKAQEGSKTSVAYPDQIER